MSEEQRIDIKSMTLPELTALMKEWGEPGFRAGQLFSWLHDKRVTDWSEMTNLSAALRQKLAAAQEGADALVRTVRGVGYCIKPSS